MKAFILSLFAVLLMGISNASAQHYKPKGGELIDSYCYCHKAGDCRVMNTYRTYTYTLKWIGGLPLAILEPDTRLEILYTDSCD